MDEYEIKITRQAQEQLQQIIRHIAQELKAPATAQKWLTKLEKRILSLSVFPGRVALTEEEPWHSQGVHKLVEGNFLIYFWIDEAAKVVQVTAVIYGRRDQMRQLNAMEWE